MNADDCIDEDQTKSKKQQPYIAFKFPIFTFSSSCSHGYDVGHFLSTVINLVYTPYSVRTRPGQPEAGPRIKADGYETIVRVTSEGLLKAGELELGP